MHGPEQLLHGCAHPIGCCHNSRLRQGRVLRTNVAKASALIIMRKAQFMHQLALPPTVLLLDPCPAYHARSP